MEWDVVSVAHMRNDICRSKVTPRQPTGAGDTGAQLQEAGEADEAPGSRCGKGAQRWPSLGLLPTPGDRKAKDRVKSLLCPRRNRKDPVPSQHRRLLQSEYLCPPKIYTSKPNVQCPAIRRRAFGGGFGHEGVAFLNGVSALKMRPLRDPPPS